MKTSILLLSMLIIANFTRAQIGIYTSNPQGALHFDGAKDNPAMGIPTDVQQANDFTITSTGNVGIGTITPSSNLHIKNRGTATGIGTGESTNTGLLIENPIANSSILSILRTTGAAGTKQTVMGINPNINGNNGLFVISRTPGATDFVMDLSSGNIGIANNVPTNTLDVAGSTRIRTMDIAAGATIVTPVYSDANGVLNKAVTNVYGTVINNTVNVTAGATGTLITGIPNAGVYKAVISVGNACARTAVAEYYVTSNAFNSAFSIKGIDGLLNTDTTSKGPVFTEVSRTATSVVWSGVPNCAGGTGSAFSYTLTMPSADVINITNNGDATLDYRIILTRFF